MKRLNRVVVAPICAGALILSTTSAAWGQARQHAVFVSNNGNLEGSVTAFTLDPYTGLLAFVNRVVTGSRPSTNDPCGGCNAQDISISPSGQFLATIHPAGSIDGLTVFQVASDAVISQAVHIDLTPGQDGPLDIEWVDDEYFGVVMTTPSPNKLEIYRFNPAVPSLTRVDSEIVGSFTSTMAAHPTLRVLYASDTTSRSVFVYSVDAAGQLTLIDTEPNGNVYSLSPGVTPNATKMYGGGGISGGGVAIAGHHVAVDGTLTVMAGSPFASPGSSPKLGTASDDSKILAVGHGTDATVRTFYIDGMTGGLTYTNHAFDVGTQGTLGSVRIACFHLFVTDNSTLDGQMGVYSFTLGQDGSLTPNQAIQSTQGIAPVGIAVWIPGYAKGDMNCDCRVDLNDVDPFVLALLDPAAYALAVPYCSVENADMNGDTFEDGLDIAGFAHSVAP
jgi:6-phosphogluconolactonase (cycloisomerase 2 family)